MRRVFAFAVLLILFVSAARAEEDLSSTDFSKAAEDGEDSALLDQHLSLDANDRFDNIELLDDLDFDREDDEEDDEEEESSSGEDEEDNNNHEDDQPDEEEEQEDIELDDEESQKLLLQASSCRKAPRGKGCLSAKAQAKLDRQYCLENYRSHNYRCRRLNAMERLIDGNGGSSRLARDLLRRCDGRKLTKEEITRLRRVLLKRSVRGGEGQFVINTLQKCDITKQQLNQLKRVLRMFIRRRAIRRVESRIKVLDRAGDKLSRRAARLKTGNWIERLDRYVGDGSDVEKKWVDKITKAAMNLRPCEYVKCPADSECKDGTCYKKKDPCSGITCDFIHRCHNGKCVSKKSCEGIACAQGMRCFEGRCVDKESCAGIKCRDGQRCFRGKCADVTAKATCKTIRCPPGTNCVDDAKKGAKCINPLTAERQSVQTPKKKVKSDGPASWAPGEWSGCSKPCGQPGGSRTRVVLCKYVNGKIAPNYECEEAEEKPEEETDCDAVCDEPPPVFKAQDENDNKNDDDDEQKPGSQEPEDDEADKHTEWTVGKWSKCSKRCDGGEQTRAVTCKNGNGKAVADKLCTEKMPEEKKECGREKCSIPDYHTILRVCRGNSWVHCNCPKGYYPLTGGCDGTTWPHRWQYNDWNGGRGWLCGGHKGKKTTHVICAHGVGSCLWQTSDGGDWHRQMCPKKTTAVSGGCNAIGKPYILRWQMKSSNGWLCGGWDGKKRTSVLCCDNDSMRKGCKTFSRKFGDWGHITCPKGTKLISGGCDADKPYLIRSSRPINLRTWQCGGWGGNKLITVTCCPDDDDY